MTRIRNRREVVEKTIQIFTLRNCDICQKTLSDEDDEWDQNELIIYLNLDECVNSRVQLDLCNDCLTPIWQKICAAINADPDDELRIGQD